jgi:hypothetical protein
MNIKSFFVILFVAFLLSSCSQGSKSQGQAKEEIRGEGLDVQFTIDSTLLPSLQVDLSLKNLGTEPLRISREDFSITTLEKTAEGNSILFEPSIEYFQEKIFEQGDLVLEPTSEKHFQGNLEILKDYYSNTLFSEAHVLFFIQYITKTSFDTQVRLNFEKGFSIDTSSISQAAPLKIREIKPYLKDDRYKLLLYLSKAKPSQSITIENYDVVLGTSSLFCSLFLEEDSSFTKIEDTYLYSNNGEQLVLVCNFDPSVYDSSRYVDTKLSGTIEYTLSEKISQTLRFPEKRTSDLDSF